ncbi:MAG: hypothetical protein J0L82_11535 [Deltaproteobacteria bacterium]|nr:hypothetical protein [Deltaproteobacteria bacterium]
MNLIRKFLDTAGLEMRQVSRSAKSSPLRPFISMLAAILLLASCAEQQPDSSGLVCGSAVAQSSEQKTNPLLEASRSLFSVPANFSPSAGTLAVYNISGTIQYERYLPGFSDNGTPGNPNDDFVELDYSTKVTSPVRRAVVQVLINGTTPIGSGVTDDNGNYTISVDVPSGTSLVVRTMARSTITNYVKDAVGVGPDENCQGASWDIRVVNNVTNNVNSQTNHSLRPQYVLDSSAFVTAGASTITVNTTAGMTWNGTTYTARSGAPFALLDTAISGLETACQGRANISFPLLYMNWSSDNTTTSGNRYQGSIATSFYTTELTSKVANLYILGKVDVDTDELDRHIVAHEFAHYLENKIYRSDSIGGSHSLSDSLDTRLAFGEGFGNAFSGIVHNDGIYYDTSGSGQASGFRIIVSNPPTTVDDRGPYSETSMQYFIWRLWTARTSFDRIGNILENFQKTTSAVTNGLTFASYYAQQYGVGTDDLQSTWTNAGSLNTTINALCTGDCGTSFEIWDSDNNLGADFTGTRRYRQGGSGSTQTADFWRLYRPLTSGTNATSTHDVIKFGGYSQTSTHLNKFGLRRLFKVTATSSQTTVRVSAITAGSATCANDDLLDMAVYHKGTIVGVDEAVSGANASCPTVTFCSTAGETYIVEVAGFGNVTSFSMSVSP